VTLCVGAVGVSKIQTTESAVSEEDNEKDERREVIEKEEVAESKQDPTKNEKTTSKRLEQLSSGRRSAMKEISLAMPTGAMLEQAVYILPNLSV
jgi:hypothetical protein